MSTKTKTETYPAKRMQKEVWYQVITGGELVHKTTNATTVDGSDTISYDLGPKYTRDRHLNWKTCQHDWFNRSSGTLEASWLGYSTDQRRVRAYGALIGRANKTPGRFEDHSQELFDKFWDQVDLNSSESVMVYSGIIQAVPMLGGFLKANQIINKIGKWATKSLRKKPFTEVVKTAISADFVNRFVIQTTLQDIHMTMDAMDYVVRTLSTAHKRMLAPTSFEGTVNYGSGSTSSDYRYALGGGPGSVSISVYGDRFEGTAGQQSLHVLAQVDYDITPLTSVKLLAQRMGVTRPLESAWDLVPFSFVADYFLRTGDFIGELSHRMSSIDGLKGRVGTIYDAWFTNKISTGRRFTSKRWGAPSYDQTPHQVVTTDGVLEYTTGSFRRYRAGDFLQKSGFWEKGGLFSPSLSATRLRTIAQLALQAKLR